VILFVTATVVLTGCVSAINEKVATNYSQVGAQAQARGDWDAARRAYARSANNADLAGSSVQKRAIFHYEYGRSLGATCFFEEAERELNLSFDLDRQGGQPLYLSLIELARLNLDQRKFPQAVGYFERAFPELDRVNAAKEAPTAFADILDEYASALIGAGRADAAAASTKRGVEIRGANPKGRSLTDRTPYGKHCARP
jgi:tetratricopeptide (TPR) repeat protein